MVSLTFGSFISSKASRVKSSGILYGEDKGRILGWAKAYLFWKTFSHPLECWDWMNHPLWLLLVQEKEKTTETGARPWRSSSSKDQLLQQKWFRVWVCFFLPKSNKETRRNLFSVGGSSHSAFQAVTKRSGKSWLAFEQQRRNTLPQKQWAALCGDLSWNGINAKRSTHSKRTPGAEDAAKPKCCKWMYLFYAHLHTRTPGLSRPKGQLGGLSDGHGSSASDQPGQALVASNSIAVWKSMPKAPCFKKILSHPTSSWNFILHFIELIQLIL